MGRVQACGQLTDMVDGVADILQQRRAGVLLHPGSLPGPGPSGEIDSAAYRFADFLAQAGFSVWQTLPLCPVDSTGSPYQSCSVFAAEPSLISVEGLVQWGLVEASEITATERMGAKPGHRRTMHTARVRFERSAAPELRTAYQRFLEEQAYWLEDYALYQAIHDVERAPWYEWPAALRDRDQAALVNAREDLADALAQIRFEQFVFDRQWAALKHYANARGIYLFGDLPIFVAHDSADVWAARENFHIDEAGRMTQVAGVPPDYFSADGQLWNMPLYRWDWLASHGYSWWIQRMRRQRELFDLIRIDHFRGFESAWAVEAGAKTAINGQWTPGPGRELFDCLREQAGDIALVAEDLGFITAEVDALRDALGLPGMRVLQFAFDSDAANPHLPHNHVPQLVVYTGTHDNDTTLGWWLGVSDQLKSRVIGYLGACADMRVPEGLNRCALASVARLAMLPLQDVLGLDSQGRMNTPGTAKGNWAWRFEQTALTPELASRYRRLLETYGRC
ncbi:MAG: 4-alpha-glucanotransferase [Pseudomonadota bacterium]|nr:4-alpha-glucanotransferase [Pseudomonadota bacterium]